jgi:hypothetical protein
MAVGWMYRWLSPEVPTVLLGQGDPLASCKHGMGLGNPLSSQAPHHPIGGGLLP